MKRQNNLTLPSADELRVMIKKESPRVAVRRDYLAKNLQVFTPLRELARTAKIDISIFDNHLKKSFDETISGLHRIADELNMFLSIPENYVYAEAIYEPLNCQREPEKSDLIFVFGSPSNLRIDKAVALYKQGIALKIMVSGKAPHYGKNNISEGERMANIAIENGIPKENIMVEKQAIATPDNVKRSVDIWEEINYRPIRITIVSSEFNLRRATMDIYKFIPWEVEIFSVAPKPSDELNKTNWIKTERGRRVILNEYMKLIVESKVDQVMAGEGNE